MTFETLKASSGKLWVDYTTHNFVNELGSGKLPLEKFKHYLCQDYLFLIEYSRAWSYAIYCAKGIEQIEFAYNNLKAILDEEINLHIEYCEKWNITKDELLKTVSHKNNTAYTDYVLKCGEVGGYVDMITALAPCMIGYAEIGKYIVDNFDNLENNQYKSWIDMYSDNEFQNVANEFKIFMNDLNTDDTNKQQQIFNRATELEIGFWDMAYEI